MFQFPALGVPHWELHQHQDITAHCSLILDESGDKMFTFLMGFQDGFAKFPCYLWDSREGALRSKLPDWGGILSSWNHWWTPEGADFVLRPNLMCTGGSAHHIGSYDEICHGFLQTNVVETPSSNHIIRFHLIFRDNSAAFIQGQDTLYQIGCNLFRRFHCDM